jgi:tRNA A-37 threonylcarbamoyl transferase component Bud32
MLGIGQCLGNYRIVGKLGHGAMGVVYEAEHPLIGKRVALKVIHSDLARNHEVVTRFFNEARAVNQIGNDHIVDVSDFGQTDEGEHFMVMEVLAGESLADRLERQRCLSVASALHIAAQLADGLAAAHAAGVVHRDLKPDNVFLVEKNGDPDYVKILDFGLAKLMLSGRASVTKEGVILGTPEYMSPEQAESKRTIDHRSDVYALGILLYQMATGLLPFVGGTMGEVLVKHVSRLPAPPRSLRAEISPAVEQIILRCLAKRPEDRFQGMAELRAALLDPDGWASRPVTPLPFSMSASGPVPLPRAPTPVPVATPSARTLQGVGVPVPRPPAPVAATTEVVAKRPEAASWGRALAFMAATLIAGVGTWWLARASHPRAAAVPVAPVPVAAKAAAPEPVAAIVAPERHVRVVINTNPSAAEIFDEASGERLGVSPVELSLRQGSGSRRLLIRHPGCGEKHRTIGTSTDAELTLDLDVQLDAAVAPPRPPAASATPPEAPPAPHPASDLLEPRF